MRWAAVGRPGLPLTLASPGLPQPVEFMAPEGGDQITFGVTGRVTGPGRYLGTDPMMVVNTLIGLDQVDSRRDMSITAWTVEGGVLGATGLGGAESGAPGDLYHGAIPLGGMGDYIHTPGRATGPVRRPRNGMAYAPTEGGSSLFDLPVEWTWSLHDGSEHPETGQVRGELQVWQPDSMVDVPRTDQQPDLPAVPWPPVQDRGGPSPLAGMVPRAPVHVSGVGALQKELIASLLGRHRVLRRKGAPGVAEDRKRAARRHEIQSNVWRGLTTVHYKTGLSRGLGPGDLGDHRPRAWRADGHPGEQAGDP